MITALLDKPCNSPLYSLHATDTRIYLGYDSGLIAMLSLDESPVILDVIQLNVEVEGAQLKILPVSILYNNNALWVSARVIAPSFNGEDPCDDSAESIRYRNICDAMSSEALFKITCSDNKLSLSGQRNDCSGAFIHNQQIYTCMSKKVGYFILDDNMDQVLECEVPGVADQIFNHTLIVVNGILYLLQRNNAIDYFDIKNPLSPIYLGTLKSPHWSVRGLDTSYINHCFKHLNYLVITNSRHNFTIVDINCEEDPALMESESWPYTGPVSSEFSMSINSSNNYLLCVGSSSFQWVETTPQKELRVVSEIRLSAVQNISLAEFQNNTLGLSFFTYNGKTNGVILMDVTDTMKPVTRYLIQFGVALETLPEAGDLLLIT